MRLIDADTFKRQIAGMAIVNNYPPNKVNALCELIDNQPIAYDVGKVVEQIRTMEICGSCLNNQNSIGVCSTFCDVGKKLEIIKRGGVNEDN